jgi:hypothetical protein
MGNHICFHIFSNLMLNKNTKRIALRPSRTGEKFKTITVCELILEMPNSIFLLSGVPACEQPTQPIIAESDVHTCRISKFATRLSE